jgi:hypothetical protein
MLSAFELENLKTMSAADMVTKAKNILNQF